MANDEGYKKKTALTPEEMITAAFMHYVRQVDQQDIAIMMGGVNMGRVNDACRDIGIAVKLRPRTSKLPATPLEQAIEKARRSQVRVNEKVLHNG